jgi:hypothetical protein
VAFWYTPCMFPAGCSLASGAGNPTFLDLENVREDVEMWDPDQGEVELFLQGLQKAGLKYARRTLRRRRSSPN